MPSTPHSKENLEFITVAAEFCLFLEQIPEINKHQFLSHAVKYLPLLYLKTSLLLDDTDETETEPERIVTETDYEILRESVASVLGMREYDYSRLRVNEKVRVHTVINGKVYPIEIQYVGNESCKDGNNRSRMCAKFSASTVPGTVFKGNERIAIWMSLDSAKIPVKVTSKLKIGEVNVELTSAQGTK